MTTPWMHMLYQLCPTYNDIKITMDRGPIFAVKIYPNENEYTVIIKEDSPIELTTFSNSEKLKNIISWADQILEKSRNCKKISQNTWIFKFQKDAEKFQTLFYLSWDQSGSR